MNAATHQSASSMDFRLRGSTQRETKTTAPSEQGCTATAREAVLTVVAGTDRQWPEGRCRLG